MASAALQVQNFVGKVVNDFEILKLIGTFIINVYTVAGQGKFSYVFKARRNSDGLCVALKLIKVRKRFFNS